MRTRKQKNNTKHQKSPRAQTRLSMSVISVIPRVDGGKRCENAGVGADIFIHFRDTKRGGSESEALNLVSA